MLTAHASDPDGGAFSFSLASSTVPFSINSSTGDVTVTDSNRVDREVRVWMCQHSYKYLKHSLSLSLVKKLGGGFNLLA